MKKIKCYFNWCEDTYNSNKINAIKTVREAFGIGLKEAKDLVEYGGRTIILNPSQFGTLVALCWNEHYGISYTNVRIVTTDKYILDLSDFIVSMAYTMPR